MIPNMEDDNINNPLVRTAAVHMVKREWEYFENRIESSIFHINQKLMKKSSKEKLNVSFESLRKAVSLIDKTYEERENGAIFDIALMAIEHSIKNLCKAFMEEEDLKSKFSRENKDNVRDQLRFYYNEIWIKFKKKNFTISDKPSYGYSAIINMISFVRNINIVHDTSKPEYLVRLESLDNVYSLVSILTLTFCAVVEMLELWKDSI